MEKKLVNSIFAFYVSYIPYIQYRAYVLYIPYLLRINCQKIINCE